MGASVPQCLRSSSPLDGMDVPVSWSHNAGDGQVSALRALQVDIPWKRQTLCARDTQHNSQQKRTDRYLTHHGSFAHLFLQAMSNSLQKKKMNVSMTAVTNGSTRTFNKKMKVAKKMDRMQDWMSPMDQYRMQHSLAAIFCA